VVAHTLHIGDAKMTVVPDPVAVISLHALARRIQRGFRQDGAAVLEDIACLIPVAPGRADGGRRVPDSGGRPRVGGRTPRGGSAVGVLPALRLGISVRSLGSAGFAVHRRVLLPMLSTGTGDSVAAGGAGGIRSRQASGASVTPALLSC